MPDPIPFDCPACCGTYARLLGSVLSADAIVRCDKCGTEWRIELYEVEEDDDAE